MKKGTKMKKVWLSFVLAIVCLLTSFGFASCDLPNPFAPEYAVTCSVVGGHGTLTSSLCENKVKEGEAVTFTLTPDEGYKVKAFKLNDEDMTASLNEQNAYTKTNVKEDLNAVAVFVKQAPTAPAGGSIPESFFIPSSWYAMPDDYDGSRVTSSFDGGVKHTFANVGANVGFFEDSAFSFMLNSDAGADQNGFTIRFRVNENNNAGTTYYELGYQWGKFFFQKSGCNDWLTQAAVSSYVANDWNRIDLTMKDTADSTTISLSVNNVKVNLTESTALAGISYVDGNMVDTNKIAQGHWFQVKNWGPYVALRSVNYQEPEGLLKVACIGDSITFSQGASFGKTYPEQLQTMLGSGYKVNNYGYCGAAILPASDLQSWTYSYWTLNEYTQSVAYKADIYVIQFGTNDAHFMNWGTAQGTGATGRSALFKSKYIELINAYKAANADAEIYLCKPPKTYGDHYTARGVNIEYAVNPLIDTLAQEQGCKVIDNFTNTQNMSQNFPDGVHANDTGYGIIAQNVYNAIKA